MCIHHLQITFNPVVYTKYWPIGKHLDDDVTLCIIIIIYQKYVTDYWLLKLDKSSRGVLLFVIEN